MIFVYIHLGISFGPMIVLEIDTDSLCLQDT